MMVRAIFALMLSLAAAPLAAQQFKASDGDSFLTALKEGNSSAAVQLLEKPGSTVRDYRGLDGNAALHIVVRNRDGVWLGYLLGLDADPNIADRNGDTPLILAARMGFGEGAARLLMRQAQVDKANKLGETALIVAVQQRQPGIVRMLLEAGANPDKADHAGGYTARDYAKRDTRSPEILRLIETVKSKRKATVGPVRN